MTARRIAWAVWLLAAACLHLFGNSPGTLTILLLSVICPVVSIAAASFAVRKLRVDATFQTMPNKSIGGTLRIFGGIVPIPSADCRLLCENLLTGERTETTLSFHVWREAAVSFEIRAENCGMLRLTMDTFRIYDLFRLTEGKPALRIEERLLIPPEPVDVRITVDDMETATSHGERYSTTQAGNDPSETYAIREYVPGDLIRSIHWKLSEKTGRLLVRETARPVLNRVLVLLAAMQASPLQAAAMAETLFAVSHVLTRQGVWHTLGWTDAETGAPIRREICDQEDIDGATEALMSNPVRCGMFMTVDELEAYAHVVIVCAGHIKVSAPGKVTLLPVDDRPENGKYMHLSIG